jgi:hypothetical protein
VTVSGRPIYIIGDCDHRALRLHLETNGVMMSLMKPRLVTGIRLLLYLDGTGTLGGWNGLYWLKIFHEAISQVSLRAKE